MSSLDLTHVPVSQFLTETGTCPVQTQEGIWTNMRKTLEQAFAPLTPDEVSRILEYEHKIITRRKGGPFLSDDEVAWNDYTSLKEKILDHNNRLLRARPKVVKHAGHELGSREFTLTYSPKWLDDFEARREMTKAIDKLCKYYGDEIVELRAVGEVGSNGLSHVHCFYKLRGGLKISDKNFKRAWKYWNPKKPQGKGFEGGHHATVKIESDFRGYIEKDIDSAWLEKNVDNRV